MCVNNPGKEPAMFRASIGGMDAARSRTVYQHALVRLITPLLAPLAACGGAGWSPLTLGIGSILMSWDPGVHAHATLRGRPRHTRRGHAVPPPPRFAHLLGLRQGPDMAAGDPQVALPKSPRSEADFVASGMRSHSNRNAPVSIPKPMHFGGTTPPPRADRPVKARTDCSTAVL